MNKRDEVPTCSVGIDSQARKQSTDKCLRLTFDEAAVRINGVVCCAGGDALDRAWLHTSQDRANPPESAQLDPMQLGAGRAFIGQVVCLQLMSASARVAPWGRHCFGTNRNTRYHSHIWQVPLFVRTWPTLHKILHRYTHFVKLTYSSNQPITLWHVASCD